MGVLSPALTLLPSHLSASERNPNSKTNFNLKLNHPLLARLERCTSMVQLQQIHAQIITTGLIHETFAASRIIAFCAFSLHGDLNYALALFNQIDDPNLFIWNAMIRAFSRSNHPEKSLQFYVDMLQFGCIPDSYTFPFLLKSCSHLSAFPQGQQIHAHVLKSGFGSDSFVANSLIHMYAELGWIELAGLLFEKMPEDGRNEVSWTSMIAGLISKDSPEEALAMFVSRDWKKTNVDQVTLATVLSACGRAGNLELGKDIHFYIAEEGIEMGLILRNSLLNMYAKCGCMKIAHRLFTNMPERDLASWNILISGYSENEHFEESLELLSEMKSRKIRANEATFLVLISACQQLEFGLVIHNHAKEAGLESELSIGNALIDMYSRIGSVAMGRKVFDNMPTRDIVSWNSMIAGYTRYGLMDTACLLLDQMPEKDNCSWSAMIPGYVRQGRPDKAVECYKYLLFEGIKPDKVTIISVLSACSHLGALAEGTSVHLYLAKTKMQIDTTLGTALIDMYAKCGCLEKAVEVFERLLERDVFAWTALISGLAIHGHGKEAIDAFRKMQCGDRESIKPNSVTFLSVLSACAHAGLVGDGQHIYDSMLLDYGIEPEMEHNGCMVGLLGRAGLLNEAVDFMERLGLEVDVCVWGALLGACRIHGNIELAEFPTKKILKLEPKHHGAHVLMSNIYADARQTEFEKDEEEMKDEEIMKEVGQSWIEVNGVRCKFTVGNVF